MFTDDFEAKGFYVDLDMVLKDKRSLAVTRLLAADLKARPYIKVGDFLANLSDDDLQTLVNGAEPDAGEKVKFDDLLLIALMLNNAEGLPPLESVEGGRELLGKLITFLVVESLARKKLVRVFRENMSFGEDMDDCKIAEKL